MKKLNLLTLLLALLFVFSACKKEEKNEAPTVSTQAAVEITAHSARIQAVVDNENGAAVTSRGFCWSENPDPGLNDLIVNSGFGPGDFDVVLQNLNSNTTYYFKAFAINANGTSLGQEMSFTTDIGVDPGPTLYFKGGVGYTSGDATIQLGSTIKFGVIAEKSSVSNNKLTRFKCILTSNNIPTTIHDTTLNVDSFNWETQIQFSSIGEGEFSFEITDMGGLKAENSILITVEGLQTVKYSNIELGSWNDAIGSFFATSEGVVYNTAQTSTIPANQAKIDFLFYKGTVSGNTIASPDDVDANTIADFKLNLWTNKNATRFNPSTISAAQFDAIGTNYQFPAFNLGLQSTKMNQLMVGEVFLFKTQGGKLGLIKIVDLYTKGDKVKIDVVMEK